MKKYNWVKDLVKNDNTGSKGFKFVHERCVVCDFSESNPESLFADDVGDNHKLLSKRNNRVFLDPRDNNPICYRCWNETKKINKVFENPDYFNGVDEGEVELVSDEEIRSWTEESID